MEEEQLRKKLSECETLGQMLNVLAGRYDLQNCKVGFIAKPMIIQGLVSAYKMLKPKTK